MTRAPKLLIVFDDASVETAPWMRRAAERAGLSFIDNEAIGVEMAVPAAGAPGASRDDMGAHYRSLLKSAIAGRDRVALHGWGWLAYAEGVSGCILDGASALARAQKVLPADRILELAPTLRDRAKEDTSVDFIGSVEARGLVS